MTQPTSAKHARKTKPAIGTTATKPAKSRRKAIPLLALGVAAALVAGQVAGASYYGSHFVPGTTVNGEDVSNLTEAQLAQQVAAKAASWKTTVAGQGLTLAIGADDIDLDVSPGNYARHAKSQTDAASWALDLAHPRHLTVSKTVSYNKEKLDALVDAAVQAHNQNATPPKNAWCTLNQKTSTFEVTQEALGTALDASVVKAQVEKNVARLSSKVSLNRDALLRPQLTSRDAGLLKAVDTANAYAAHAVSLTKDGKSLAKLDKKTVATWVRVGDDLSVSLDQGAIAQWAHDSLAKKVAKSDEEHDYAIDAASLAASVADAVQGEKNGSLEVPLTVTATRPAQTPGHEGRGRHIDLNLSTQYARFYDKDGSVIWRSYFVSGNTSEGRGTPMGTFKINAKRTNETLIGADEDGDGEPDYKSHVTYWMPFVGNAVGLHDANWRSAFGGSIYSYAGSHGCVNLPPQAARELYGLVKVGDTVYVHS